MDDLKSLQRGLSISIITRDTITALRGPQRSGRESCVLARSRNPAESQQDDWQTGFDRGREEDQIVAFMKTLTNGCRARH